MPKGMPHGCELGLAPLQARGLERVRATVGAKKERARNSGNAAKLVASYRFCPMCVETPSILTCRAYRIA